MPAKIEGVVLEALSNGAFKVEIEPSRQTIVATISGKIRKGLIRIMRGDRVLIAMSPYDLSKGRITYRIKKTGAAPGAARDVGSSDAI
jgi:translation initiation factor IF-1